MTGVTIEEKDLGRQMWDLLERKPEKYDVVFSVGVTKVKVRAVKFILEAASPVFKREFKENWDTAVIKDGEGIPLVDVDPVAFQLFVKLVTLDTWSVEVLKGLRVSPYTLLALLSICRRFQVAKAIKNLEAAAEEFIRFFDDFKDTDEFLEMSQSDLATVVSSDDLPLDEINIFACVCRWAEFQCTLKGIKKSGANLRSVLGAVLFEIRFPRMSKDQFSEVCRRQSNLLSQVEQLVIRSLIGMDDQEKQKYDGSELPFKPHARKQQKPKTQFGCSTLCLTKNRKIVDSPPFVCDGGENWNCFQISGGRIALHGIGFCGPIDGDSYFDVTVQIKRWINGSWGYDSGEKEKRIFARKREIFHFVFDEPITIEQSEDKSTWNDKDVYYVWFWLKGPNTMAVDRSEDDEEALEQTGVKFRFYWWSRCNQFAEFLYKKL